VGVAGGALAYLMFGAAVPALVAAGFAATLPIGADRRRRRLRLEAAAESWPRILEEIRLRTGSLGRSIPQALFEAGRSVPPEWRPAFESAEREWLLTVDFRRTLDLLKQRLADPTADAVCETLLVAHDLGGGDLDAKLADLIEDRTQDVQRRRDGASGLAGVRFARRFVLLVPLGMAAAGLTIGSGRHAYTTSGGQLAVVAGVLAVAACWWWSGRLMRMPAPPRVFR
jgi:tight adherence protein B